MMSMFRFEFFPSNWLIYVSIDEFFVRKFYKHFSIICSIGLDGKITLEKRLKGIYVTAEKLQEARQNLVQAGKEVPIKWVLQILFDFHIWLKLSRNF